MPPFARSRQLEEQFQAEETRVAQQVNELKNCQSAAAQVQNQSAAEKAEGVLRDVTAFAAAGMTENELAAYADYVSRKAGALDVEVLLHAVADKMPSAGEQEQLPFRPASERPLAARPRQVQRLVRPGNLLTSLV